MATRQPIRVQTLANSDTVVNNNVESVVGILATPINSSVPPTPTSLSAILVLDPNNQAWNLLTNLPVSLLPLIPSSLLPQANEIEFNYRFQGGF